MVTHPFHPLAGRRLRVLFSRRRWIGVGIELVCEIDDEGARVVLRQEWTDRGPEPTEAKVSVESLSELRAIADAISAGHGGSEGTDDAG